LDEHVSGDVVVIGMLCWIETIDAQLPILISLPEMQHLGGYNAYSLEVHLMLVKIM
jgi:hypothetical protein